MAANKIHKIENNSFYNLDSLTKLSIGDNFIDKIPTNALHLRHASNVSIEIYLGTNPLNWMHSQI